MAKGINETLSTPEEGIGHSYREPFCVHLSSICMADDRRGQGAVDDIGSSRAPVLRDGYEVGGRIILPMSFTGGPRYMYAHYLDALAICRKLGNPQFFITFTCNVNWPEIKRFMSEYPHLTASDRADVVCRVFEQKIQALIAFLKEERIFGDVTGVLYTVEFQKRGLPHCHTLLWVDSASRIRIVEDVDRFILAELPDPRIDPEGYNVVSKLMMHGPCGATSSKAPCMKGDKCSKKFPKKFIQETFFDENGHVHYRRRDTSVSATRNEFQLDNSYYLFKYISKGTDRVFARVYRPIGESSTAATPSRQGYTLYEIEIILSNCGKSLHVFGLPPPPQDLLAQLANRLLMEERNYNQEELAQLKDESELIFVYGHGKHFSGKPSLVAYVLKERLYWQSHPWVLLLCFYRQIEVISSCISESTLWPSFKVFTLKHNMRLARPDISLEERSLVHIPPAYYLPPDEQGLSKLIDFIYDQSTLHTPSATTLQQKAIVCPKNETADIINLEVLDMVPGASTIYMSQDKVTPTGNNGAKTEMLYPIEHLNTLSYQAFLHINLSSKSVHKSCF
ncbi:DNA helicase [Tanacetum coccineum]